VAEKQLQSENEIKFLLTSAKVIKHVRHIWRMQFPEPLKFLASL
jgi:hypothetical protein